MTERVGKMSKYTTEVRYICESMAGLNQSEGYMSVSDIIEKSIPKIFDFNFPIFDENYRGVLERKILKHYYTREIGLETYGLWKLKLDTKLNEIMDYYNQLYKSALLEFNPFYDTDLTRKRIVDTTGTNTSNTSKTNRSDTDVTMDKTVSIDGTNSTEYSDTDASNNNINRKNLYSDTPQGAIDELEANRYLTNATIDNNVENLSRKSNGEGSNKIDSTEEQSGNTRTEVSGNENENYQSNIKNLENYIEEVKGKAGGSNYSKLLKEFRETFLNIDMMIINDLSDLFMNLW